MDDHIIPDWYVVDFRRYFWLYLVLLFFQNNAQMALVCAVGQAVVQRMFQMSVFARTLQNISFLTPSCFGYRKYIDATCRNTLILDRKRFKRLFSVQHILKRTVTMKNCCEKMLKDQQPAKQHVSVKPFRWLVNFPGVRQKDVVRLRR